MNVTFFQVSKESQRMARESTVPKKSTPSTSSTETTTISSQRSKRPRLRWNECWKAPARCRSSSTTASVEKASL